MSYLTSFMVAVVRFAARASSRENLRWFRCDVLWLLFFCAKCFEPAKLKWLVLRLKVKLWKGLNAA